MVVTSAPSFMTASVKAGDDAPSIDEHRAGAALTVIATLLGSREVEILFAQRVQKHVTTRASDRQRPGSTPFTRNVMARLGGDPAVWLILGLFA